MTDTTTITAEHSDGRLHLRTAARRLRHPIVHVTGLLAAHVVALALLEKTPLLALLSLH